MASKRVDAAPWFDKRFGTENYSFRAANILLSVQNGYLGLTPAETWDRMGFPPYTHIELFPSNSELPSAIGVVCNSAVWVGINGTDSLPQMWKYTNPYNSYAYLETIGDDDSRIHINGQFVAWGREVFDRIYRLAYEGNRKVYLHGHSYGGAVALSAAVEASALLPPGMVRVMTFGQPKVGSRAYYQPLRYSTVIRWMNTRDPVPGLPFSEGEVSFPFSLPQAIFLRLVMPEAAQTVGGRFLRENGTWITGYAPKLTPGLPEWILFDRLGTESWGDFGYHYLTEYRDRLMKGSSPELKEEEEFNWLEFLATEAFRLRRFLPTGGQMILPSQSPFIPKEWRATTKKSGDDWGVVLNGDIVAIHASKTKCHSLTKALNHFLRRSLLLDPVYTETLINAFRDFTLAAFAGGNGFRPDVANFSPT